MPSKPLLAVSGIPLEAPSEGFWVWGIVSSFFGYQLIETLQILNQTSRPTCRVLTWQATCFYFKRITLYEACGNAALMTLILGQVDEDNLRHFRDERWRKEGRRRLY